MRIAEIHITCANCGRKMVVQENYNIDCRCSACGYPGCTIVSVIGKGLISRKGMEAKCSLCGNIQPVVQGKETALFHLCDVGKKSWSFSFQVTDQEDTVGSVAVGKGVDEKSTASDFLQRDSIALSIIIPTWNQWSMMNDALLSLKKHTSGIVYQIILIDNASWDKTSEKVSDVLNTYDVLIKNSANLGFLLAVNQGLKLAEGKFVLLLNNDILVHRDNWWKDSFNALENGYDLVGPTIRSMRWQGDTFIHIPYGDASDPLSYLEGWFLMAKRELFDKVGLLDTRFSPAFCEDVDLCWRVREAGMKLKRTSVPITHLGSKSLSAGCSYFGYNPSPVSNKKLAEKWGSKKKSEVPIKVESKPSRKKTVPKIHMLCPFYRVHFIKTLISYLEPEKIEWYPIVAPKEDVSFFDKEWIHPVRVNELGPKDQCYKKFNDFLDLHPIFDDDYYGFMCDETVYEPGLFDTIRKQTAKILVFSSYRGDSTPNDGSAKHPAFPLVIRSLQDIRVCAIGLGQYIVKGSIFRANRFGTGHGFDDGNYIVGLKNKYPKDIAFLPDLFVFANYLQPGRITSKKGFLKPNWKLPVMIGEEEEGQR